MRLELSWPPVELSPNYNKGNWEQKSRLRKSYFNECFYTAKAMNVSFGKLANIPVKITFHPKTKNTPDLDNCLAWIKSGLDGVAKACGINDRQFRPITLDIGEPVKGGKVLLEA